MRQRKLISRIAKTFLYELIFALFLCLGVVFQTAWAADTAKSEPAATDMSGAEQVNVDKIKEKYWARGDESELGVVQNRLYSKANRFEFSLFGGIITSDPFLSVQTLGASFGYHFNEYVSLHFIGMKPFVSQSGANAAYQESIQSQNGVPAVPSTNYPKLFLGSEARFSLLYGKLSVVGKSIIYYDFHLLGGLGVMDTESGNDLAPSVGLGQQIFLSKSVSLNVDYRMIAYHEYLIDKTNQAHLGQQITPGRMNYSNTITVGLSFLFGIGKGTK